MNCGEPMATAEGHVHDLRPARGVELVADAFLTNGGGDYRPDGIYWPHSNSERMSR